LQIKRQESRTGKQKKLFNIHSRGRNKNLPQPNKATSRRQLLFQKKRTEKPEKKPQANPNSNNAVFINIQLRALDR